MVKIVLTAVICFLTTRAFSQCSPATAHAMLDVNNVHARVNNGGDMWWDLLGNAKYSVPSGDSANALFAGALWIGGLDQNDELHVAAQTYRQNGNDYFPGLLDANGNVAPSTCSDFDRIWQVYGYEIDQVIALWNNGGGNMLPQDQIPADVLQWPGKGNPYNPIVGDGNLAPFFDRDGDNAYDPTQGDYPLVECGSGYADQMIWWVFNDKGNAHGETGGEPLGVEVQAMAYAYNTPALNQQTFYCYKITNKSANTYHDIYAGLWVDPDVCSLGAKYVGSDSSQNMGIVYSRYEPDLSCNQGNGYGDQPPLLGFKILKGLASDPDAPPMTHSMFYSADFSVTGNPQEPQQYYGYLKSEFKDGEHLTRDGDGYSGSIPTNYAFPDSPDDQFGFSECTADSSIGSGRHFIVSSGPGIMQPGESRVLNCVVLFVQPPVGTFPCPSLSALTQQAGLVQRFYDDVPDPRFNTLPEISIYPNPAVSGQSAIVRTGAAGTIFVMDSFGRQLREPTQVATNGRLDLSTLTAGCYLVKFTNHQGVPSFAKLIVQ